MQTSQETDRDTLSQTRLAVSEIFHSMQGEGPYIGTPAVFLRLAFCNLRCVWCDTKYTWDWANHDVEREVTQMPAYEVIDQISRYPSTHIVLTGGEPLLQQRDLLPLLENLQSSGYTIEVETAGTLRPERRLLELVDLWNVSPKLANSENPASRREIPQALEVFSDLSNASFKFVVVDEGDVDEVIGLIRRYDIPKDCVYLMPEACDRETLSRRSFWVSELCVNLGFRFTTRLQVELWNGVRGR